MSLFLFGGEVLRGFAFTMLVGIVTGTYSTVFIASAIAILLSTAVGRAESARRPFCRSPPEAGVAGRTGRQAGRRRAEVQGKTTGVSSFQPLPSALPLPLSVSLLDAALLGVVQGLTEFLPISSTAHLLLGARLLAFDDPGDVFKVVIQFGSILAVMWLYRAKIWSVVAGLRRRPDARRFALMILAAFLPAAVAGLLFADFVEERALREPAGVSPRRSSSAV